MENFDTLSRTNLVRRCQELTTLVETDRLTRLGNSMYLERRTSARGGWFVMADLDGFKRAQDLHPDGHAYGDRILQEFATFLRTICRTRPGRGGDRVAIRLHGDEFIVWTPYKNVARRLKAKIRDWVSFDGDVRASAGMGQNTQSADAALFMNKRARRTQQ